MISLEKAGPASGGNDAGPWDPVGGGWGGDADRAVLYVRFVQVICLAG